MEVLRLETTFPVAKARVMVLDRREGVEGEQAMTAYVAEDLSAPILSDDMIRRRDQWIPDLSNWERKRLEYRIVLCDLFHQLLLIHLRYLQFYYLLHHHRHHLL